MLVTLLTTPHIYGDNVFEAVYVVSPSVKLDSTWRHLINYRAKRGQKEEDLFFDHWDESVVQLIMDEYAKLTEYHKKHEHQYATSVCIVVDDMADQQHILHATGNSLLNTLFIRGRHVFLSCLVSSQRPSLTSSIIRTQQTGIFIFKQRNYKYLDLLLIELGGWVPRKVLRQIYDICTKGKYNFMMVNLLGKDIDHMFYWTLDKRIIVSEMGRTTRRKAHLAPVCLVDGVRPWRCPGRVRWAWNTIVIGCDRSSRPLGPLFGPTPYAYHQRCSHNRACMWDANGDATPCPTSSYDSGSLPRTCSMIPSRRGSDAC